MAFPKEVLDVKISLQENKDNRFETMRLLTEPREENYLYIEDLEKMWNRLLEFNGGFGNAIEHSWIYAFLNAAHKFKTLPNYFYASEEDKRDIIFKVEEYTEKLEQIIKIYGLNNSIDNNRSFVDALQLIAKNTTKKLQDSSFVGKVGENVRAVTFVRLFARHNEMMFGETLNSVIKTATFAIYNKLYSDSDISNHLNRRK